MSFKNDYTHKAFYPLQNLLIISIFLAAVVMDPKEWNLSLTMSSRANIHVRECVMLSHQACCQADINNEKCGLILTQANMIFAL